jgi:hypothetical protein
MQVPDMNFEFWPRAGATLGPTGRTKVFKCFVIHIIFCARLHSVLCNDNIQVIPMSGSRLSFHMAAWLGFGRMLALHHHSTTLYQLH